MISRRGQVTIFVIIAILIIAAVVLFFVLRAGPTTTVASVPESLQPAYQGFLSCLEDDSRLGIDLLMVQGGYIDLPSFEPGSEYMPFSSQLNFVGNPIPYWYYVSGNNIHREQVPTKEEMKRELESFIDSKINFCNLDYYSGLGYDINLGTPNSHVEILGDSVEVILTMDLFISKTEESTNIGSHRVSIPTKLGNLYDAAVKVYEKEQSELFLEEYGLDVLRSYAPVDGVELTCSPMVWDAEKVFDDLASAIEVNTLALTSLEGGDDYFKVDLGVDENVRFINSKEWSSAYQVNPTEGRLLISSPVGNQQGLGIIGFCYVPYHFVYDVKYPVLIQVYEDEEIFQFPVAVIISGNQAREPLTSIAIEREIPEFCNYKNTLTEVHVFDSKGRSVEGDVSYACSGTTCYLGSTTNGILETEFPQCVGGTVLVRSEGHKDGKETYSSTSENRVDVFLDKYYNLDVEVEIDSKSFEGEVLVSFTSDESSSAVLLPDQKTITLSPGEYEVQVFVYSESNLELSSSITEQCVEVPRGGLGGLIGLTEERCFEIEIPEQILTKVLSAGGKTSVIVLDSTLEKSSKVIIDVDDLPDPNSLEQLQQNYILFEGNNVYVDFR